MCLWKPVKTRVSISDLIFCNRIWNVQPCMKLKNSRSSSGCRKMVPKDRTREWMKLAEQSYKMCSVSEIQSVFTRETWMQIPETILVMYLEQILNKFNFFLTVPSLDYCTICFPWVAPSYENNRSDIFTVNLQYISVDTTI